MVESPGFNAAENPNLETCSIYTCSSCHFAFELSKIPEGKTVRFCIYCGAAIPSHYPLSSQEHASANTLQSLSQGSCLQTHLGSYQILHTIGKGGMGEVFLAYDTNCGRKIALKRIRTDLMNHIQIHNRFLKEARITSQLTHPAIMPIYSIQSEGNLIYYTMPYIEGETLKQILRKTRSQEKHGLKLDHLGGSIPALARVFITICQAVAYAHSQGILHRDLKPENIMIGRYGEVVILDWGLAKTTQGSSESDELNVPYIEKRALQGITNIGRVVGTISCMAPERAVGQPATFQTDIYSLGVILYQMLTLRLPFRRGSLKEFRLSMHEEFLHDPAEVSPYRDVPPMLSRIATRCLSTDLEHRYQSVDEMIRDLENYIEGRSEWFFVKEIDAHRKSDWEFQENVLIAEYVAITRETETSDWVNLMISKESFPENTRIETRVRIGETGHGIGFLLSIPEAAEREHLNDGYCLWLGTDQNRSTKLLKSTVEVMHNHDVYLKRNEWYLVTIEKIDNNIHFYLNNVLQFSYISHMPQVGTHIGLLVRDADFSIGALQVHSRSQNITVNCLAVPDTFLAHKDYITALNEYRRIGYSFPGRAEGREALFKAGITLLEQAKVLAPSKDADDLYEQSLKEFEKLHQTPGAPLEYLGKALVYQTLKDYEEEIKCFELAYRRYPHHPSLKLLQEQIVYRMHDCSRYHRKATYNFILLVVRHIPSITKTNNARKLFSNLEKHWEPLYFIEEDANCNTSETLRNHFFAIQLSFWLAKPYLLDEIIEELAKLPLAPITVCNALFCLIELGAWKAAAFHIDNLEALFPNSQDLRTRCDLLRIIIKAHEIPLETIVEQVFTLSLTELSKQHERVIIYLCNLALEQHKPELVHRLVTHFETYAQSSIGGLYLNCANIRAYLAEKNWRLAGELLLGYPLELLSQETTPLHFLYGCWLYGVEGKEIAFAHFSGVMEVSYPRSWTLGSHFVNGKIQKSGWQEKAFLYERRQLFKQLALFYHCSGESQLAADNEGLEQAEKVSDESL